MSVEHFYKRTGFAVGRCRRVFVRTRDSGRHFVNLRLYRVGGLRRIIVTFTARITLDVHPDGGCLKR